MTYDEATAWLYRQTRGGAPRDPRRMQQLVAQLGLGFPERTVHVTGTNGKGTVTAMIAAGLTAAGYRTGRFTSPHVESFCERIAVDGALIPPEAVAAFVAQVAPLALTPPPAFFEWSLALALAHFARERVSWAVIEAGVGVARDATAITENVQLALLTNVTLEHQEVLGPDVAAIARDKSAVIRPGVPLVTAAAGEALAVIRARARACASPLYVLSETPLFALPEGFDDDGDPARRQNARLAAAGMRLLGLPEAAVAAGLCARLPARRERFWLAGRQVILDGAHNPAAAQLLRRSLTTPYVLLFGALARKQGEATLAELAPGALATIITAVDGAPGVATAGRRYVAEPEAALQAALELCPPGACVLISGSLYLAGRLRRLLTAQVAA